MEKNIEINFSSDVRFHYKGVFVMWVIQKTTDGGPTGRKSHIFPKKETMIHKILHIKQNIELHKPTLETEGQLMCSRRARCSYFTSRTLTLSMKAMPK